ncbi:MAG: hypothetical protein WBW85_21900, partial [Terriglobales bacterium]
SRGPASVKAALRAPPSRSKSLDTEPLRLGLLFSYPGDVRFLGLRTGLRPKLNRFPELKPTTYVDAVGSDFPDEERNVVRHLAGLLDGPIEQWQRTHQLAATELKVLVSRAVLP